MASSSIKELHGAVGIYFNSVVGSGLLGKVCRAKCGLLPCVAKVFNDSVILPNGKSKKNNDRTVEFEKDCKRLLSIRHPSLVQYLGIANGPTIQLPLLFMEVLNKNLTQFLDGSTEPLPFHMQINICYDVCLGLVFLHFNSIVHGALSSNNVLLIGEASRAKLADFGLQKYISAEHLTSKNNSALPYLAPEVLENQNYSTKTDSFSFGVLLLQILSRQPPTPTAIVRKEDKISEVERRKENISLVDPNHQLLPTALDCLKDESSKRLSSQVLCELLASIRKEDIYQTSRENHITSMDELWIKMQEKEKLLKQRDEQIQQNESKYRKDIEMMKEMHEKQLQKLLEDFKNSEATPSSEIEEKTKTHDEDREEKAMKDEESQDENADTKGSTWMTDSGSLPSPSPAPERVLVQNSENEQPAESECPSDRPNKPEEPECKSSDQETSAECLPNELDKPAELEHPPLEQAILDRKENEQDDSIVLENSPHPEKLTDSENIQSPPEASMHEDTWNSQQNISVADSISHQDSSSTLDKNSSICDDIDGISHTSLQDEEDHTPGKDEKWSIRSPAPETMCALYGAATTDGEIAYFSRHYNIYSYSLSKDKWAQLKSSNYQNFSLVILDGSVITIGGISRELKRTKNLYGFSNGRWRVRYSSMPNHRVCAATLVLPTHLIIAGGRNKQELCSIDVMDRSTGQWHSLPQGLPEPMGHPQVTVCRESIYICKDLSIYSTPISCLLDLSQTPQGNSQTWKKCKDLPSHMGGANLIAIAGKIVALGGHDSNDQATGDICSYNDESKSWRVLDHMPTPCGDVLSVLLPDDILIIVGGWAEAQFYNTTSAVRLTLSN